MGMDTKEVELHNVIDRAILEYGATQEALVPILSEINHRLGYIPPGAMSEIRRRIQDPGQGLFLADSHIFSVASFYHMFSLKPTGNHVIRYCKSAPCHVEGGRKVIQALENELCIKTGETSPDKKWSLIGTSCLGICSVGPVFIVDEDAYGNVTPEKVPEILARYKD